MAPLDLEVYGETAASVSAYPLDEVVTYTYNLANRLLAAEDWAAQVTQYGYDRAGRLITTTLPSGVVTLNQFDPADRLIARAHRHGEEWLGQYTFAVDGVGNRRAVTETLAAPGQAVTTTVLAYLYDGLGRLTGAEATGAHTGSWAFAYDAAGNRAAYTRTLASTEVTTYTYDAANRLATQDGQARFLWDANGNLLADGDAQYAYDPANRLITATVEGVTSTFAYNGDGARVQQMVDGAVTTYTLDLAAPLVQVLVAHAPLAPTRYLYGMARVGEEQGSLWVYHLTDGLGSVRQLASASGIVTLARGYMPYGEAWWSEGEASSAFGFAGEQYAPYAESRRIPGNHRAWRLHG